MENKRSSLIFTLLLFILLFSAILINQYFNELQQSTYNFSSYIFIKSILFIPAGLILGISKLINEKKKSGQWQFNYFNFIILGIPALLIMFYPFIFSDVTSLISTAILKTELYQIFALIFGFSIISNWKKVS